MAYWWKPHYDVQSLAVVNLKQINAIKYGADTAITPPSRVSLATKYQTVKQSGKIMYAIEFETDVHNNTIQIPIEYKELEAKH